ncbi:MAG TPA: M48 family metalloprotease [Gemmatimonadaceae bacterium]|nr:M48 family metalloprotease [Gemmatimonadaceae bacterium]
MRLACATVLLAFVASCGVSDDREIAFGRANAAQIDAQLPLVTDSIVTAYVQALGERMATRTSRAGLPWRFTIVNSKEINAFAVPGGFVYVNRGLIERSERMDELAGAMGHEIGHIVRRHSVQQLERNSGTRIGIALLCAVTNVCDSRAARVAIDVGGAAWLSHYSRAAEAEADSEAVANTTRADIDPEGIPALFRVLLSTRQQQPGLVQSFFASHPLEEDRIAQTQRLIDRVDPTIERSLTRDDKKFQVIKRRLAALPSR